MTCDVILVDDEEHLRIACTQSLVLAGLGVDALASAGEALDQISRTWAGVLVTDIKMAGMNGLELMARAMAIDPELPVILITGHGDVPMAVKAMREGAYDFLEKPFASELFVDSVRRALEKRRLTLENRALRAQLEESSGLENTLVGRSSAMLALRAQVASFAPADADVLIFGETGAGKELVARSLHEYSPRRDLRFVPINCGALPANIIESELFGHEAGAFTGATKRRIGKFEHADGGTLLLDEIESMPLDLQIKMLRVLQDRKITRLGSNEEIDIDVRVIAASKADLKKAAAKGEFREDLYYRLNVLTLFIPPLRERREDIPLLFHHFLRQAEARYRKVAAPLSSEAMAGLLANDWPGNVRELQNAALRHGLGVGQDPAGTGDEHTDAKSGASWLAEQVGTFEAQMIRQVLAQHDGRLKPTYEALGISRKTLYDKLQKYGIGMRDDG